MKPISVHDFLWDTSKYAIPPVCVVFGDDPFLKFQAVRVVRDRVLDGEDAEFSLRRFEGAATKLNDLLKELATRPMFGGGRRLVMVEDADSFVTAYRVELEDYCDKPSSRAVLLLQLQKFPTNTRLYAKAVEVGLVVEAKAMPEKSVPKWIVQWAKRRHGVTCDPAAADLLLQRVGPEHGLLDQELAKLALMLPDKKAPITVELVQQGVGSWRTQSIYDMLDLALDGQPAGAIRLLDRLLVSGERVNTVLAKIAYTFRKMRAATELILVAEKQGKMLRLQDALTRVGINKYYLEKTEKQMKKLGRHRGRKMSDWLLQAELNLKGDSRAEPRYVLETLLVKIGHPQLR